MQACKMVLVITKVPLLPQEISILRFEAPPIAIDALLPGTYLGMWTPSRIRLLTTCSASPATHRGRSKQQNRSRQGTQILWLRCNTQPMLLHHMHHLSKKSPKSHLQWSRYKLYHQLPLKSHFQYITISKRCIQRVRWKFKRKEPLFSLIYACE